MTDSALGTDQRVDVGKIEKSLADLWRTENENDDHAVTRAALWNVVAHTSSSDLHARADLSLIARVSEQTTTTPADLNWVRLEEWRSAAASIFDPPHMRSRLTTVGRVRVVAATGESDFFGHSVESLLFSSWISAQLGHQVDREGKVEGPSGAIDYRFERHRQANDIGGISLVEIV